MNNGYIEIKTTFRNSELAEDMAEHLVRKRIVASAHVHKVKSTYIWKGVLHHEKEAELICITRQDLFGVVKGYIVGEHQYECPEVISTPILNISKDFADWVDEQVRRTTASL